ncbi:MAG: hypothetical protein Q9165_001473 [Trypethelium subeluteriae]
MTDVDSTSGENHTFKITGPRNAAEFVLRDLTNQVEMFFHVKGPLQGSLQRQKYEHPFEKEAQDKKEASGHGKTTSFLSGQMRQMMRLTVHPVVMVTATKAGVQPSEVPVITSSETIDPRFFCAMTVSSMTTVSLSPDPIVSFNIKTPSRTLDAIMSHNSFNMTLLSSNRYGVRIADAFTHGDAESGFRQVQDGGATISFRPDCFPRAPTITSQGAMAHCACKVLPEKCVQVVDHVIIVAQVKIIKLLPAAKWEYCLSYTNGRYRRLGNVQSSSVLERNFEEAKDRSGRTDSDGIVPLEADGMKAHSSEMPAAFRKMRRLGGNFRKVHIPEKNTSEAAALSSTSVVSRTGSAASSGKASSHESMEVSSRSPEKLGAALEDDLESDMPREARYNFPDVDEPDEDFPQRQRSWPVRSS